jgi:hypothetical protein
VGRHRRRQLAGGAAGRHAAALGTAAAAAPVAGEFSPADYATALAGVTVVRGEAG